MDFLIGLLIGTVAGIFVSALFGVDRRAGDGLESLDRDLPKGPY
jgi:gas vesicle protein